MSRDINPFGLRMPPELKDYLAEEAKRNGRSLNAEILYRLEQTVQLSKAVQIAAEGSPMDTATTTLQAGIEITRGLMQTLEAGLKVAKDKLED